MTNIASSLPDPTSFPAIGWILIAFVTIVWGANQVVKFASLFREKPSPPDTYPTKEICRANMAAQEARITRLENDVSAIASELKMIRSEIASGFRQVNFENERRAKELHDRINPLLERKH